MDKRQVLMRGPEGAKIGFTGISCDDVMASAWTR